MTGTTFTCPACGAPLELTTRQTFIKCPFCKSTVVVPFDLLRDLPQDPSTDPATEPPVDGAILQPLKEPVEDLTLADPIQTRRAVEDLIQKGQKIEAIKELRKAYPIGLAEAKRVIDGLEAGQPVDWEILKGQVFQSPGSVDSDVVREVTRFLQRGQKIEAIKFYRTKYPVGLKEAKDAVEEMEAAIVAQGGRVPPPKTSALSLGCMILVAFSVLAVILVAIALVAVR